MPPYRFYCLDGAGHISHAEWFDADDDAGAVAKIRRLHPDKNCEVWRGATMIGAIHARSRDRREA